MGHLSVLEHGTVTMYFTGVSRSFTHELIRHRHFSYSQLSQRYVPERNAAMVEPDVIAEDPELHKKFVEATEASVRAYTELLEALSDAAAEITSKLGTASVEVRLRGRDADFTVTELAEPQDTPNWPPTPPTPSGPFGPQGPFGPPGPAAPPNPPPGPPPPPDSGDLARITLRLPEPLKAQVEQAAAAEGTSVNAWLVRAIAGAVAGGGQAPPTRGRGSLGRRFTGYAQA